MESSILVQSLIEQISQVDLRTTNGSLQPHTRQELQGFVKRLTFALESPFETLNRLVVLPFQHAVVRVAIDLQLFRYMVEAGENSRTVNEIEAKTGVDAVLLREPVRPRPQKS
ncbi:MAG: hypothetical protein Q9192_002047 [Flavoplaca navasiana]